MAEDDDNDDHEDEKKTSSRTYYCTQTFKFQSMHMTNGFATCLFSIFESGIIRVGKRRKWQKNARCRNDEATIKDSKLTQYMAIVALEMELPPPFEYEQHNGMAFRGYFVSIYTMYMENVHSISLD